MCRAAGPISVCSTRTILALWTCDTLCRVVLVFYTDFKQHGYKRSIVRAHGKVGRVFPDALYTLLTIP